MYLIFTNKVKYTKAGPIFWYLNDKMSENQGRLLKAPPLIPWNKLLRTLNGTTIKDMKSTTALLKKFDMLAVNQLNAQIKLLEIWKALNVENYPLAIKKQNTTHEGALTRADRQNRPCEVGKSSLTHKTCISDAIRLWNLVPEKKKLSVCGSGKERN